jgi:hypothetical protein
MKHFTLLLSFLLFTILSFAQVHVRGYYRSNGTYVQPHMRSSPDGNPYNNYSYPGNTNPYTGKVATGDPDTYLKNYYNRSTTTSSTSSNSSGTYSSSTYPSSTSSYPSTSTTYPNSSSTSSTYGNSLPSSSSFNNDTYLTSTTRRSNDHFMNLLTAKKKYLKDAKGNYTGEYLQLADEDEVMRKYTLYDANDFPKGKLIVYANGQRVLFDNFGNVVARSKYNHSPAKH